MEVVINVCFGGFSLSDAAETLYMKKKGLPLFRYKQTKYSHRDGINEYVRCKDGEESWISFTFTKDHGEKFNDFPDDKSYWSSRDIDRDDPLLVEVVRELGSAANGSCASLKIVDVPKGIEWEIDEYDGNEHVAESHRAWS